MPESLYQSSIDIPHFKAGGALTPLDLAFDGDVYSGEKYFDQNFGVDINEPQVIASPKGTGKTTLVYLVRHRHHEYAYEKKVFFFNIEIPKIKNQKVSEKMLKLHLSNKLESNEKSSLVSILSSSATLKISNARMVLHIEKTERLEGGAIEWLLSGVRELIDNQSECHRLMVQVLLNGSCELHRLTSGRNSKFPIRQVYPLEFDEIKLKNFVTSRFAQLNITVELEAIKLLWQTTNGDKFFTQKICLEVAQLAKSKNLNLISEEMISSEIEKYVSTIDINDFEKRTMAEAVFQVEDYYYNHKKENFPWEKIHDFWNNETILGNQQRELIYEAGLVRRVNEQDVEIRAPIVLSLVKEIKKRIQHARVIIQSNISIKGIAEEQREEAESAVYNIEKSAALGELINLHAGSGRYVKDGFIEIEATALHKGHYKGTIEWSLLKNLPIGSDLWILIWGFQENNEFISKFKYFRMSK